MSSMIIQIWTNRLTLVLKNSGKFYYVPILLFDTLCFLVGQHKAIFLPLQRTGIFASVYYRTVFLWNFLFLLISYELNWA